MNPLNSSLRIRRSSRIILIDPQDRVLLFRFDVSDRPPFWVTAGGECDQGESFEEAGRRELLEETGIIADPGKQIARTTPEFVTVEGELVQADERYFIVHASETNIDTSRHTALEQKVMTQHRWFSHIDLANWPEAIFPQNLIELIVKNHRSPFA